MSFSVSFPGIDCISRLFSSRQVKVGVLRLDQVHPVVSGNKWFKLRYYLEAALTGKKKTLVTKGGAWSNHIVATAYAAAASGLNSTGIIRGEEPAQLSSTLQQAEKAGMQLVFTSRTDFAQLSPASLLPENMNLEDCYFVNEGGYGIAGAEGMCTALEGIRLQEYSHLICAAGTGTMTAGLLKAALPGQTVITIPVLKGYTGLEAAIRNLLTTEENKKIFSVIDGYHEGGYAKKSEPLLNFMNEFYNETGIPSDFVYTGKLFRAVTDLLNKNYFPPGSSLLIIHSGGLQGNRSLPKGKLIFG